MVVMLIAIFTALAVSWDGSHLANVEKVNHQRNAQEIVSMGVYATIGDAEFVISGNKMATVQNLITGTTGRTGTWKGQIFRLGSLNQEALPSALQYVKFENDLLIYDPKGGQP